MIEIGLGRTAQPAKLDGSHSIYLIRQADTRQVIRISGFCLRFRTAIAARLSGENDVLCEL